MRGTALAGLIVLAAGACGTEPVEIGGSYTLSAVEGTAPPYIVIATVECDVSIAGGRLTFGAAEQFELVIDMLTDCSRGGGSPSEESLGYIGSAEIDGRRVTFHVPTGTGPLVFEGLASSAGPLTVEVPLQVASADQVSVRFLPE